MLTLIDEGWRIEFDPSVLPRQRECNNTRWRCRLARDDERQRLHERTFDALCRDRHIVRLDAEGFVEVWGLPGKLEPFDPRRVWRHFDRK